MPVGSPQSGQYISSFNSAPQLGHFIVELFDTLLFSLENEAPQFLQNLDDSSCLVPHSGHILSAILTIPNVFNLHHH